MPPGALSYAGDVSAASEETSAQVDELVASSRHIASMAEALREQVRQFEVDEAVVSSISREEWAANELRRAA
ncbi:MAG: hypothetical protein R3A46_13470 [Thermomicrobiales bacterium]